MIYFIKTNHNGKRKIFLVAVSVFSFFVMALLMFGELHTYFFGRKEYDYRFTVDTDYDEYGFCCS